MIEDPSNLWLVHPLSDRLLAPALRLDIHPNTISFAGMGFGALAGYCYAHWQNPLAVVAGFMLMVTWHVMDGLDGKLFPWPTNSAPDRTDTEVKSGVVSHCSAYLVTASPPACRATPGTLRRTSSPSARPASGAVGVK
jgi:hypothetical protein